MIKKERKHALQMSEDEQIWCQTRAILAANYLVVTKHAKNRYSGRHLYINPAEVGFMMTTGQVIEYERCYIGAEVEHIGAENIPVTIPAHTEERVVMRCHYQVQTDLSIVIDITNNKVITLWTNSTEDRHQSLNLSLYDRNLKVY